MNRRSAGRKAGAVMTDHGGTRGLRVVAGALAAVMLSPLGPPAATSTRPAHAQPAPPPWTYERVSVGSLGGQSDDHSWLKYAESSPDPSLTHTDRSISDDGRFVVFASASDALVSDDTNGRVDVFLHDRVNDTTHRMSLDEGGREMAGYSGGSRVADAPSISGDGRTLVFHATQDIDGDSECDGTSLAGQVYAKDVLSGAITPITPYVRRPAPDGGPGPFCAGLGTEGSISRDGRVVGFLSHTWDYGEDALLEDAPSHLFTFDLATGVYDKLTVASGGTPGRQATGGVRAVNLSPRLDRSGTRAVYLSSLEGLAAGTGRDVVYAYLRDRNADTTAVVSLSATGEPRSAESVSINDDGRLVAFTSRDDDVVPGDTNGAPDVFVRDLNTGTTRRVSVRPDGTQMVLGGDSPAISGDGSHIVFRGSGGSGNTRSNIWVYDVAARRTARVTPAPSTVGTGVVDARTPAITRNGCIVGYAAGAPLTSEDTNAADDVYVSQPTGACVADPGTSRVTGTVSDGHAVADRHSSAIDGARVELRRRGAVVHGPIATTFGRFRFDGVAPGRYRLRVTLTDEARDDPVFDVRHGHRATGPVWAEFALDVDDGALAVDRDVLFSSAGRPVAVSSDVPADRWRRLDDLAVLFRNLRAYTVWIADEVGWDLASDAFPAPVETYAYSQIPTGAAGRPLANNAFYRPGGPGSAVRTVIHIAPDMSSYADRDGIGTDMGPTVEWHELTHHIDHVNILPRYSDQAHADACRQSANHYGYLNPSTCDSVSEGLAAALPTLFRNHRESSTSSLYPVLNVLLESNALEAFTGTTYARNDGGTVFLSREEFAYAALLWDLMDDDADGESTQVRDGDYVERLTVYRDMIAIDVRTLMGIIAAAGAVTVRDVRAALFDAADIPDALKRVTVDVDRDGNPDLAPLDLPFVMHGFYPVEPVEARADHHHYDVETWRYWEPDPSPDGPPNRAVGFTNSADPTTGAVRNPRLFTPRAPNAYVRLRATDREGRPVAGARATVTVVAPEGRERFAVSLPRRGGKVYLELPTGVSAADSDSAGVPTCSGGDATPDIVVRAHLAGRRSDNTLRIDGCRYMRAVATQAETPRQPALVLPPVRTDVDLSVRRRARRVVVRGVVAPAVPGGEVTVKLQRRRNQRWQTVRLRGVAVRGAVDSDSDGTLDSRFRARLRRADAGRCRVVAVFAGDSGHRRSRDVSRRFRC